jgi:hypothetical protein
VTVALNTLAVLPYIGNGTASVFPVTFPTFENENIQVEVSDVDGNTEALDLTTDFTLADIGKPGVNGSVTLVNNANAYLTGTGKLKTGYTLYVKFAANVSQPMKGRDWGQFAPERFERTLDRLAMNIAAVKAIASKALAVQTGDGASVTLPSLAGNASKILQVKADESGFEYGVTSGQIQQWALDAQTSASDAEQDRIDAQTAAGAAASSESAASTSAGNAASQASAAQTYKNNAQTYADGAAASASQASQSVTDANTAKNAAVVAQGLAEDARDAAIQAANDTSLVAQYKIDTEGFRDEAEAFRDTTLTYRNETLTYRNDAVDAANDAGDALADTEVALAFAEIARDEAEVSANQSELFANLQSYSKKITITVADSPFTVDDDTHADTLIIVDDSGGNVVINLPPVSDTFDQPTWKVGFMKKAASGNNFTVNRDGTDTINGMTSVTVEDPGQGLLVYPGSPTNWTAKYFLSVIAADGFILQGARLNFGDPSVDGNWSIAQVGSQLKFQQRQAGAWVDSDVFNPPA